MKKSIGFLCAAIFALFLLPINIFSGSAVSDVKASEFKSQGVLSNAVVYLTFEKNGHNYDSFDENFFGKMQLMYNSSDIGVKNYFLTQSKGNLVVNTTFFGEGECIKLNHDANYYKPRYEWKNNEYEPSDNLEGYDNRWYDEDGVPVEPNSKNSKQHIDGFFREQALIREIASKCNLGSFNGDYDNDGKLDSLVLITDADISSDDSGTEWGEILWPHMGAAYDFPETSLNKYYYTSSEYNKVSALGKAYFGNSRIGKYNFLSASEICRRKTSEGKTLDKRDSELYDVGLLCHEMAHNLGLFDYYSYEDLSYESVGEFDILANYTPIPQNMLAYMRLKMGWLGYDDILYINYGGTYTLPFNAGDKGYSCAKIVLSDYASKDEYFMLEARSNDSVSERNPFDSCLSGKGLIIYRVAEANAYINAEGNTGNTDYGNMYGKDEVYVFRDEKQKSLTTKSFGVDVSNALLSDSLLYNSKFGSDEFSNNIITYSDSVTNSRIVINNVKINADDTVTFTVALPDDPKSSIITLDLSQCSIVKYYDGKNRLYWSSNAKNGKAYVIAVRTTDRLKRLAESNKANITIEDVKSGDFSYYKTLYKTEAPLAEKMIKLPDFEDNAMIFLAIEDESGYRTIRYVGEIPIAEETFSQSLSRVFDPVYLFGVIALVLLVILTIVLIFTSKRSLKRRKV